MSDRPLIRVPGPPSLALEGLDKPQLIALVEALVRQVQNERARRAARPPPLLGLTCINSRPI